MDGTALIAPAALLHCSLLIVVVCFTGRSGPRNDIIGIRTWATTASEKAWETAHAAALPWSWATVGTSAASLTLGVMLYSTGRPLPAGVEGWYTGACIAAFGAVMAGLVLRADRAAKHILMHEGLDEESHADP